MITLLEILDKYWVVISAFFGGVGFLFGKKERKVNLQDKIHKLNAQSIDYIRSDFGKRIDGLQEHIEEKTKITDGLINELKASNEDLEKTVVSQRGIIDDQKSHIERQKKIIDNQKSHIYNQKKYITKLEEEINLFKNAKSTAINT